MAGGHALYRGTVTHARTHQVRHAFTYPLYMHLFDVDALEHLDGVSWLVGYNRRRPVAIHDRDHFDGQPIAAAVRTVVERAGGRWPGGRVLMLAQPRIFGYVFNPISVYYCLDRAGALDTVVTEVHNTYGERHVYVLGADAASGGTPRAGDGLQRWRAKKAFHVSPFLSLEGTYEFALSAPDDRLAVDIDLAVSGQRRLATRLRLERRPFSDAGVAGMLVRYPLMTVQVIAAIYWEALRLWWKGVPYRDKPAYAPKTARRTQP